MVASAFDSARLAFSYPPFLLGRALVWLAAALAPAPITFFVFPTEATDLGEGVEMGVAYWLGPPKEAQPKPGMFVCNVGHFDSLTDLLRTSLGTVQMCESLKPPAAAQAGFAGQYLALFSSRALGSAEDSYRELNLTAWTSEAAAHEWYVNNEAHKAIVKQHRERGMDSFGALIARLVPAERGGVPSIKWQARCRECRALLAGYPENVYCASCGALCKDAMPLF